MVMNLKNSLKLFVYGLLVILSVSCAKSNKEEKTVQRRVINPWTWQDKYGFVQSNEVTNSNRILYTAGIVSVDKDGNLLYPGDMAKQVAKVLDNMEVLLKEAGYSMSDVVRFTYYTTNVQEFTNSGSKVLINRLKETNCKPATSLIGVASLFHPDCVVEIEAVVAN